MSTVKNENHITEEFIDDPMIEVTEQSIPLDEEEDNTDLHQAAFQAIEEKKKCDEKEDDDDDDDIEEKNEDYTLDLSDDIKTLTDGETGLSEGFKDKAQTIFESAVDSKVKEITMFLDEEYEEKYETQLTESVDFIVESVNKYLDYVVNEWLKENELAVENGLRTEIAENFIDGLKNLFQENYMEVPEEKTDLVQELADKVDSLKEELNEVEKANMTLFEELNRYRKDSIIEEHSTNLTLSQRERFKELCEGVDFSSEEQFTKKVRILKESYFNNNNNKTNNNEVMMNESYSSHSASDTLGVNVDTSRDAPTHQSNSPMDKYLKVFDRDHKMSHLFSK